MLQQASEIPLRAPSQVSIGFPERGNSDDNNDRLRNPHLYQTQSDKDLPAIDQCCIGLYCQTHHKLLTAKLKNKGVYIPNFSLRTTDSWYEAASNSVQNLIQQLELKGLNMVKPEQLINIMRIQLPKKYPHYLTRLTFVMVIFHKDGLCYPSKDSFAWNTLDELKKREELWGPEPIEVLELLKKISDTKAKCAASLSEYPITMNEYSQSDALKIIDSQSGQSQMKRELLLSAKFTSEEIQKFYNEFVMQCFPSQYMTLFSFKRFMAKINWTQDDDILYKMIFWSFVASADGREQFKPVPHLTFDQLVMGLAVMEESADHRGNSLRLRLRYIFNFYDINQDGKIDQSEMERMVNDMRKRAILNSSETSVSVSRDFRFTQSNFLQRMGADNKPYITCEQFVKCADSEPDMEQGTNPWIADLTEMLFRTNVSQIDLASVKFDYKVELDQKNPLKALVLINSYEEPCEQCRFTNFIMCAHGVRIDETGLIKGTIKFDLSPMYKDTPFMKEFEINDQQFLIINNEQHRLSNLAISMFTKKDTLSNRKINKETKTNIIEILKLAKDILRKEPFIINCMSPCYFISEIWSNLRALNAIITSIFKMSPFVNPVNCVFLGNYLDPHSLYGVETILYLLCFKILMPKRIILLRGNNESRKRIQNKTFQKDCLEIFGKEILNHIIDIFQLMPYCAVVDDSLYIASAGIPSTEQPLNTIVSLNPKEKKPVTEMSQDMRNIVSGRLITSTSRSYTSLFSSSSSKSSGKSSSKSSFKKNKSDRKSKNETTSMSKTSESSQKTTVIGFTGQNLRRFLRMNNFSHFIRSEHKDKLPKNLIAFQQSMITLIGLGHPSKPSKHRKITQTQSGTIALANRFTIRILRR